MAWIGIRSVETMGAAINFFTRESKDLQVALVGN